MGSSAGEGVAFVYHAGALGDFITALPCVVAWRKKHPGRAVLLGRPQYAGLAEPPFDDVLDAGSSVWAPLFAPGFDPHGPPAARLPQVSSALLFAAATSPIGASLAALGVAEILRHDPFPPGPMAVVDYHLSLLGPQATAIVERIPRVRARALQRVAPGCVALHPGSGSPSKCWPRERFLELARWLRGVGRRVVWITGPAEAEEAAEGAESWRNLDLVDLGGRLAACDLFVGNDSGVTHLAAAVGCTTMALFGATSSIVWGPRGRRVTVVNAPGARLDALSAFEVIRLCEGLLSG